MDTVRHLVEKAKAGYPALYLLSPEDQRSIAEIEKAAKELKRRLFVWTFQKGVEYTDNKGVKRLDEKEGNPDDVLKFFIKQDAESVLVLRHYHHYLDNPAIQALLLDMIPYLKTTKRQVIILTPVLKIPAELDKELAVVEAKLPGPPELKDTLKGIAATVKPDAETEKKLIEAAMGLTTNEAESAFSLAFVRPNLGKKDKKDIVWDPSVVMEEKCAVLKKTGIMTYYAPTGEGLKAIGGMQVLKDWVGKRKGAFTEKAREFGLPFPKGLLSVGPPGSGKSAGARAIADELGLPLIRVDMGAIFGGLVGESESNARKVISTLEAVAPCVAWLDEIEKGFAGSIGGALDSGVGARVLGTFLTWMQEKKAPVFVYATANNVRFLPPELLRKGRFDEMFSVMLPNSEERKEIFKIHINRIGRAALVEKGTIDVGILSSRTKGFSGAEIEAVVKEALFSCFADGKELNMVDLQEAISSTAPLERIMKDEIEALIKWCEGRTRMANLPEPKQGNVAVGVPTGRTLSV
jgi:SpoVK/Ycf46/Vps4 family AAA+-type ATPase